MKKQKAAALRDFYRDQVANEIEEENRGKFIHSNCNEIISCLFEHEIGNRRECLEHTATAIHLSSFINKNGRIR